MDTKLRITLKSLVELGLDLNTGKSSKHIYMRVLESHSGIPQTSNGSRIIRRDNKVFKLFLIDWCYDDESGSLKSVRFNGYKDCATQKKDLEIETDRLKTKIKSLQKIISENENILDTFNNGKGFQSFSVKNLIDILKVEY